MTDAEIKLALSDRLALGLTAWAEARGDAREGGSSVEERIAVCWVCKNRVTDPAGRWARSFRGVCLAAAQFSCWNPGPDANHQALMRVAAMILTGMPSDDPLVEETLYLADGVLSGVLRDPTRGANHYYAPASMIPPGSTPSWAIVSGRTLEPSALIGRQRFYRL